MNDDASTLRTAQYRQEGSVRLSDAAVRAAQAGRAIEPATTLKFPRAAVAVVVQSILTLWLLGAATHFTAPPGVATVEVMLVAVLTGAFGVIIGSALQASE